MALSRRTGQRFQASIWPGFVDAMTALLLVLMFVLTIFMIVQFVLSETITGQETELDDLSEQVQGLADALGLERNRGRNLESEISQLGATLAAASDKANAQTMLIATLTARTESQAAALAEQSGRITGFEAQVALLLTQRDGALSVNEGLRADLADLQSARDQLISDSEAAQLALAAARDEIDAGVETARLASARREALELLLVDLRRQNLAATAETDRLSTELADLNQTMSDEQAAKLADAAAAEALRNRLQNAGAELTAMTLALESERKRAEDTLTMLAAAEVARGDLDAKLAAAVLAQSLAESQQQNTETAFAQARAELDAIEQSGDGDIATRLALALAAKLAAEQNVQDALSDNEARDALLATANVALKDEQSRSAEGQRQVALLNQQVAELRTQLGQLQGLLDASSARDEAADVQLESLGSELNAALARAASEERRRRQLEEAERIRLEAQAKDLERYRSEFFGQLRDVLGDQEGVRIEGDRFVFSSEVLFATAAVDLTTEGREEVAKVAAIIQNVADRIPPELDWVIRVDGHTDNIPLGGTGRLRDNWELSQARALSVVRYMIDALGLPPERLAATGFGEYQPVNTANTAEARAQNRRIELKFTEK